MSCKYMNIYIYIENGNNKRDNSTKEEYNDTKQFFLEFQKQKKRKFSFYRVQFAQASGIY